MNFQHFELSDKSIGESSMYIQRTGLRKSRVWEVREMTI